MNWPSLTKTASLHSTFYIVWQREKTWFNLAYKKPFLASYFSADLSCSKASFALRNGYESRSFTGLFNRNSFSTFTWKSYNRVTVNTACSSIFNNVSAMQLQSHSSWQHFILHDVLRKVMSYCVTASTVCHRVNQALIKRNHHNSAFWYFFYRTAWSLIPWKKRHCWSRSHALWFRIP